MSRSFEMVCVFSRRDDIHSSGTGPGKGLHLASVKALMSCHAKYQSVLPSVCLKCSFRNSSFFFGTCQRLAPLEGLLPFYVRFKPIVCALAD